VIFPAGEVSHFRWTDRAVTDSDWNPIVARLVGMAGVRVVPAYVKGGNGLIFQLAGMAHPDSVQRFSPRAAEQAWPPRRGPRRRPDPAGQAAGHPDSARAAGYLRWRTYLLANREGYKPRTNLPLFRRRESSESSRPPCPPPISPPRSQLCPRVAH